MKLTEKLKDIKVVNNDPRVRTYLTPVRIVKTFGKVENAEHLLKDKVGQAVLEDIGSANFVNTKGKHAAVLLDFGREIHGTVRICTQGCNPERNKLLVRFGESCTEALTPVYENNARNDHANRDMVVDVGFLMEHEFNETGFRFFYIELLGENCSVSLKSVQGVLIYRDIDYIGSFECNDGEINKIFDTAAYTAHLNMQEYMWDGIKRDRLVWIGDMHPEVMTICSVFGSNEVVKKSLDFIRDVTPVGKWMNGISSYSMWWIMCHYEYFMQNGDTEYLKLQMPYLKELTKYLTELIDENGSEIIPDNRFLNWPDSNKEKTLHCGLQGLLKITLDKCALMFDAMGETEASDNAKINAEKLTKHVPDIEGVSKAVAGLIGMSGIVDPKEADEKVISKGGAEGYTTFYSFYTLCAKALAGNVKGALKDMKDYYGAMLNLGATTFWEDFDIKWAENAARIDELTPEGKIDVHASYGGYCYEKLRHSLCHGWSSGPVPFLLRYVLGIEILEPGCKKVRIKPNLAGLKWVRGSYPTPYGKVEVYFDGADLVISAPDEIEILK
ncbi:MAG: alpha-L-rhamnosidase [Ruminococcaceae bacterium]|nr:alpha-L-rhamnosidase [Oscillospiraceae bacterium]